MANQPGVSHTELGSIPLFRGLSAPQLDQINALWEPAEVRAGVLFEAEAPSEALYMLTAGSITLHQGDVETHKLHPLVVIGELGALTEQRHTSKAVVSSDSKVWQIHRTKLSELFAKEHDLGLALQQNLLSVLADKVYRDQVRLEDMRHNIIHTQKAMKGLREFLLESEDTKVSQKIHEVLDDLIKRNRRVNYRVEPPPSLAASLRLDKDSNKGKVAPVVQLSRTELTFSGSDGKEGDRISGVLTLCGPEIPVSGKIVRVGDGQVELRLDLLLDEYAATLEGYLTRVQMLDFVV